MNHEISENQIYLDHDKGFAGTRRYGLKIAEIWVDEDLNTQVVIAESQLTADGFWDMKSEQRKDKRTVSPQDIADRVDADEIELV